MFDVETSGNMMVDVPNMGRVACLCRLEITKTNDRHLPYFMLDIRTSMGATVVTDAQGENRVVTELLNRLQVAARAVPVPYHE